MFGIYAVTFTYWLVVGIDDMNEMVSDTVRERVAYTVARAAFPHGSAECHTAAVSDIRAIIADVDADRVGGDAIGYMGYAFRDSGHEAIKQAVGEWIDDGPAAPYECAAMRGMRADARAAGVLED